MTKLIHPEESYKVRGAAFDVYKQLRNRHKEKVYQNALEIAMTKRGLTIEREKKIIISYEDKDIGTYIPDFIVNEKILIEIKAKPSVHEDDLSQFWYYLKNSNFKLGFLINFGGTKGVEIVRRVYDAARSPVTPA